MFAMHMLKLAMGVFLVVGSLFLLYYYYLDHIIKYITVDDLEP